MDNIFETIGSVLGGKPLQNIQQQTGEDQGNINNAIGIALPLLVNALAKNSSDPVQGQDLYNAVQKDHDGSILDNIIGLISNPESNEGPGILDHVLGNKLDNVGQTVSKQSGMNFQSVMKILMILAPIIMGVLGKRQKQNNMGQQDLSKYLNNSVDDTLPGQRSIFDQVLDGNNDGNISDDLAKIGSGLLGKFLR